jgi:hypothetical protein
MAEWKPGRIGPKIGNRLSKKHEVVGIKALQRPLRVPRDTQRPKAPRLPCASYWSFPKQRLPHYCAVQHENARFKAKFFVTFSFALG